MTTKSMQQAIDTASTYIAEHAPEVAQASMRQTYHLMGPCGWINDPNGLIYYRGQYHFFYQFNPYSGFWGKMHWGHAVSDDLLHWTQLPMALAPSEPYDDHPQGGCFSGSAIEKDGKLYVAYTGTANHGNGFVQTQNIAISEDGVHFTKYEGNPVIEAPSGVPTDYFRDPKMWEHEGLYYMVVGAQRDGKAQALLYRSENLLDWEFLNVMHESRGEWGYMWECPDFFPLKDKWVFLCSPMGAGERTTVYFVGDIDYATGRFVYTVTGESDWGFDFYAPQTFVDAQGCRIAVGWANGWDWMPFWKDWGPTYQQGWCGSLSVPREVVLNDDLTLSFRPVAELDRLRADMSAEENVTVRDGQRHVVQAGDGVHFDLSFALDLEATRAKQVDLLLRCGEGKRTVCTFDLEHAEMSVDRNDSDGWSKGKTHSPLMVAGSPRMEVEVIGDTSSLEIFINGGRVVHSLNVFAPATCNEIAVEPHGGDAALADIRGYALRP